MKFHNMNAFIYQSESESRTYFCSYNAIVCVIEHDLPVPCVKFGKYANYSSTTSKQLTRFLLEFLGMDVPAAKRRKIMANPYVLYHMDGLDFMYTPNADWSNGINGKYTYPGTRAMACYD